MPSGPRLAAVRPHLHGDPCPSGSEPLILTYNFGILHILSQNARFMLNLTGQLGWPTLYKTGAKMSLTHHKQIHEIWPGLAKRSKIPFHFLPPTPVYYIVKEKEIQQMDANQPF